MGPGLALKRAIHMARAAAGVPSDVALATTAGLRYQTLMDWYAERSRPTPGPLGKVAEALGVPVADLWAAWERRPAVSSDIGALIGALNRQADAISDLVSQMRAWTDPEAIEARDRASRAELQSLRDALEAAVSAARSAPREKAG